MCFILLDARLKLLHDLWLYLYYVCSLTNRAAQLEADIYSVCVVNDQAALAVLSWQYLAVNVGFCGTAGLSDGRLPG